MIFFTQLQSTATSEHDDILLLYIYTCTYTGYYKNSISLNPIPDYVSLV